MAKGKELTKAQLKALAEYGLILMTERKVENEAKAKADRAREGILEITGIDPETYHLKGMDVAVSSGSRGGYDMPAIIKAFPPAETMRKDTPFTTVKVTERV